MSRLNPRQQEAVNYVGGPLLVLAGAGSGKTSVITRKIAHLIQNCGIRAQYIVAMTFTNKAASEMRGRIEKLLAMPVGGMWVGTFHGIAHRLLRAHYAEAGLPQGFAILDSEDQYRLIRRTLKALDLPESRWPPRQVQGFINKQKDEGHRPQHLDDGGDFYLRRMLEVYTEYESACTRGGMVDFAAVRASGRGTMEATL